MSISIYYTARREEPLSLAEQASINDLKAQYSIDNMLAEYHRSGKGPNWTSFCVFDSAHRTDSGVSFEGATNLPDNSQEAVWTGLQHWCRLLAEIRRALPKASWHVHVDDRDLVWDVEREQYDLWA